MINTLVEKWVCASFFQPSTYLETLEPNGLSHFSVNPAHTACGGLDTVGNYFIVAAVVMVLSFNALLFAYAAAGAKRNEAIGGSLFLSIVGAGLWPITTFAFPLALLGWLSWRSGKGISDSYDNWTFKTEQRQLEERERLQELKPYIDQLDQELEGPSVTNII